MNFKEAIILIAGVAIAININAQLPLQQLEDSLPIQVVSNKYLQTVSSKAGRLEKKLNAKSAKALKRFQRLELSIQNKLLSVDSLKRKEIIANSKEKYNQLEQRLQDTKLRHYIPSLDSIGTSLKFLEENPQFLSTAKDTKQALQQALGKINGMKGQLQKAEEIKKFLKERKQYFKEQLQSLEFGKKLKKLNKQVYYYGEQLNGYKELLKDHKKVERNALKLLSKTKLFNDFMRKNSMLASLFRLQGDPNDPLAQASLAGLQTRSQVTALIQNQIASGGPNAPQQLQQNIQQAQAQLNEMKSKLNKWGKARSDDEIPEGFKPNNHKTKSFIQRLELGTNIQSQKVNGYFPITSDIGMSLGYKMNDRSILGIGVSYKMGWGQNIRHINITYQGVGLRSFIDWKIKGSFWLSGGYETNYRSEFRNVDELKNLNAWQQSGLIGLSKVVSLKTKFVKKTKLQLSVDLLSFQQVPQTEPVVLRIGYNF